jgi:hypothetical protein
LTANTAQALAAGFADVEPDSGRKGAERLYLPFGRWWTIKAKGGVS